MKVGIVGGGNIGIALYLELKKRCMQVEIYSSKKFDGKYTLYEDSIYQFESTVCVVNSLYDLCQKCEILLITYPPSLFKSLFNELNQYIENKILVFVPGIGGVEYIFKPLLNKKCDIIGLQRVPAVYRLKMQESHINGRRKQLHVAFLSNSVCNNVEIIKEIFNMECVVVPNYMNVTLTPSNPILHTSRLYALFSKYSKNDIYSKNPLFYGMWDDYSSQILIKCDAELFALIEKIPLDLSGVISLKTHYESNTASGLTSKMCSIKSLHNISSPMVPVDGGYIVDWDSRYFTSDFPDGLVIIKSIALLFNVSTPTIDEIIFWYQKMIDKQYLIDSKSFGKDIHDCNIPQNNGIKKIDDLINLYNN